MTIAAIFIFILTLTFVIWQPSGLNIGWSALAGASFALILGIVTWHDVWAVTHIVWNATLAFVAIILLSLILDRIGFFEWAALHMSRLSGGNGKRMFFSMMVLGALVSMFFANDGAALIMTPIVLAMMRTLRFESRYILPFVMACGFISDTSSIPFVISNLVNIVSADFFGIGFIRYASRMWLPNLFSFITSVLMLYIYYRKQLPRTYLVDQLKTPQQAIKDITLFRISWLVLALLLIGYLWSGFYHIPISLLAGIAVLLLMSIAHQRKVIRAQEILREAPWSIIVFSIGMYVVIYGLKNAGLTHALSQWMEWFANQGLWVATIAMGFLAAGLSSVMNNLPSVMIGALAIQDTSTEGIIREALIYANVIGCDLGPKMTPIGSLATLLWLYVLSQKGVKISWGYYFKVGMILTIPTLFVTLVGLYLSLSFVSS
jgi:arsenical pump membrane protein